MVVYTQDHFMGDIPREMGEKLLKMGLFLKGFMKKGRKNMGNIYGKITIVI